MPTEGETLLTPGGYCLLMWFLFLYIHSDYFPFDRTRRRIAQICITKHLRWLVEVMQRNEYPVRIDTQRMSGERLLLLLLCPPARMMNICINNGFASLPRHPHRPMSFFLRLIPMLLQTINLLHRTTWPALSIGSIQAHSTTDHVISQNKYSFAQHFSPASLGLFSSSLCLVCAFCVATIRATLRHNVHKVNIPKHNSFWSRC